jgi:hypothetical protein
MGVAYTCGQATHAGSCGTTASGRAACRNEVNGEDEMAIELARVGRLATDVFDEGAAEISAFDPVTQRLFVVNGADVDADGAERIPGIDVVDISDPSGPELVFSIGFGGRAATSVAVSDGLLALALPADPETEPGEAVFFATDLAAGDAPLARLAVGALPDMITFTPDGTKVLVANEGEPGDDVDPEGSVSIIDLTGGLSAAEVETADFSAFDGREAELRAEGVRIFEGKSVSEDVEPEYIASADGETAFVALQEANAFGVIDIPSATVTDILPLGTKDHFGNQPSLETFDLTGELPVLGETAGGQEILLGGLSGLWFDGTTASGQYRFLSVPDRGPNGATSDLTADGEDDRPFALPGYRARIVEILVDPNTGAAEFGAQLPLTRADPEATGGFLPITGISNTSADEPPVDLFGHPLPLDPFGGDLEGIARQESDGSYWSVDEYRPAIYHFDAGGVLIDRFVPAGTAAAEGREPGAFGSETLPEEYASRRPNRGFEAVAIDEDAGVVYAFIQTPLANPDRAASDASDVIRILGISTETGEPVREHVYLLQKPAFSADAVDKIGDAVWAGGGRFFVIERDSSLEPSASKYVYEIDIDDATNTLGFHPADGRTLEQLSADELIEAGIVAVAKTKVLNLPSLGYVAGDKPEGLALLPDGRLAVLNDNDFGLLDEEIAGDGTVPLNPEPVPTILGLISFDGQGNGLDASDEDGAINISPWPVRGLYMPDGIAAYEVDGVSYYITANEGDDRGEDERVADLSLDAGAFPDASVLQQEENLGRLGVSSIDGDLDGDGDYDALFSFGARSFSIWDEYGNLVFDSGDQLERITAEALPDNFNASNDDNAFDDRSDNKGPEPEGVTVGEVGGSTYAFIGLERIGGVAVYDVGDPRAPEFVDYVNPRDFSGDPEAGTADDLGPEGLTFIDAEASPSGAPLLVVTNEVSGSTSIFEVTDEALIA